MKRLALLAVTAFMAVILSACGESTEKSTDTGANSGVQQQGTTTPTGTDSTQSGQ